MKKCILVLAIVLSSVAPFAQGVNFQELTLKEACAKAKAENKLVFIDCYTDWCGQCRLMTEEIFTMKEMGDYFNPKYICIKAKAEKTKTVTVGAKEVLISFGAENITAMYTDDKYCHTVEVQGTDADEEFVINIISELEARK